MGTRWIGQLPRRLWITAGEIPPKDWEQTTPGQVILIKPGQHLRYESVEPPIPRPQDVW